MHILAGLGWGLATALLLGPVFFTLLRAALAHGFLGGAWVAAGIIVSDVVALLLCASGARMLVGNPMSTQVLALLGGLLLFALGVVYVLRPPRTGPAQDALRKRDALGLFTSGFLVNLVNPFVLAVWTGLFLHATHAYGEGGERAGFLIAVLVGILVSDLTKAALAQRLKRLMVDPVWRWVHRAVGLALVLSSARLFWMAWCA
ncbi:MAG: LysE family transporter [Flavobacteriales bacterium]|nr:LysE family transporter [Flavobacteriales bacterium]